MNALFVKKVLGCTSGAISICLGIDGFTKNWEELHLAYMKNNFTKNVVSSINVLLGLTVLCGSMNSSPLEENSGTMVRLVGAVLIASGCWTIYNYRSCARREREQNVVGATTNIVEYRLCAGQRKNLEAILSILLGARILI